MNTFKKLTKLTATGFTNTRYYESMNMALKRMNNGYTMLHYPYYCNDSDSFVQAQANLTDYCISLLDPIENKEVVEIGCGNGVQSIYLCEKFKPSSVTGIDLNSSNILIAESEKKRINSDRVRFLVDDAQDLKHIQSESVDVIINIESAFLYPDKPAFIKEIHRVLKPGGQFLIADLLYAGDRRKGLLRLWGKSMSHHFWNHERYNEELGKSELVTIHNVDITEEVKKGWSMYRKWLPDIKRRSFFQNVAFRLFYVINVRINMHLMKKQQYQVFTGYKRIA